MTLNGEMALILHYFTEFVYDLAVKQLLDSPRFQNLLFITACTVVQAVVKATSQSNGKGLILTPWGSETPERISMKLGKYNWVAGMPTHANPCGAATTWVVWANT